MSISRRDFLATSAAAAGLALSARAMGGFPKFQPPGAPASDEGDDANVKPAAKKLKILILGGTAFTGPHLVRRALARGHEVTVFNRGQTEKRIGALPDAVKKLIGDRDPKKGEGLNALDTVHGNMDKWDAVVDTSGFYPRHVKATGMLANRCDTYIYISSISAYATPMPPNADETAPLAKLDDPTVETMGDQFQNYGGLKVLCEQEVEKFMKGRCAIVRPTFISGPGDGTDRFTYWPVRVSKGGEMICPGSPSDPMQWIDVRDLAAFVLHLCETKTSGAFNAAGPSPTCTLGTLVDVCKEVSKADTKFTWIDSDFLKKASVPGGAFPIWIPPSDGQAGMSRVNFDKSVKAGMRLRPVRETVKATLEWWPKEIERRKRIGKELTEQAEKEGKPKPKLGDPEQLRAGLPSGKEKEVLEVWHASSKKPDKSG